jgi:serine/threonine-protein kinase
MADVNLRSTTTTPAGVEWDAIARLLDDALALPREHREPFLCASSAPVDVVSSVRELLGAVTGDRVDAVLDIVGAAAQAARQLHSPPSRVGPYEVLREVGRGGMGVVYLARRADGAYQRLVALKVSHHRANESGLGVRFLQERDILAGLAHPNIVPLFDAGVTDEGLPFFTMEFVQGVAIDAFCDRHAVDVRGRIRLFIRVCQAVAAAHRGLIVHRDLKPSNVLVTADHDVKLLDFGIATLLEGSGAQRADTAGAALMTPAYASPEQIRGKAVSTATDVYALGLMLYELLSGRRAHRFSSSAIAELVRVVADVEPVPLPAAVGVPEDPSALAQAEVARRRGTSVARLVRLLRGDLEHIASKALAKRPEQRYASAMHLAEDLERYLDGRAVEARGASTFYRVGRILSRHRMSVGIGALAIGALGGYVALTAQHAREMAVVAERERLEATHAREVADFIVDLFEAADPTAAQSTQVSVGQLLAQGVERAEALSSQPLLQARLLNAVGRAYLGVGQMDAAAAVATRAIAITSSATTAAHADIARDRRLLGLTAIERGRPDEAIEHFRVAVALLQQSPNALPELAIDTTHLAYALAQAGQLHEAVTAARDALTRTVNTHPAGSEAVSDSLSTLAFVRRRQGHPLDAVELYRKALAIDEQRLGERHTLVARARQNLAVILTDMGQFDDAERQLTLAIEAYRGVFGERHPRIATTLNNLGHLEGRRSRFDRAVDYTQAAFEMRRAILGADHPSTLIAQANLGSLLGSAGQLVKGERMLRDVLSRLPSSRKDAGPSRPNTMANLAHTLRQRGRLSEAERVGREALDLAQAQRVAPLEEAAIRATLGTVLAARGRYADAVSVLEPAVAIRRERLGASHDRTLRLQQELDAAREGLARRSRP